MKAAKRLFALALAVVMMVPMLMFAFTTDVSAASTAKSSPATPKNITITECHKSDKLSWVKVDGATQYTVYYRTRIIGNIWTPWIRLSTTSSTSFTVSGAKYVCVRYINMLPGTQYGISASNGAVTSSIGVSNIF